MQVATKQGSKTRNLNLSEPYGRLENEELNDRTVSRTKNWGKDGEVELNPPKRSW